MTNELTEENLKQQIKCISHEIRNHLSICDMYSRIIKKNLEKSSIDNPSIDNALECIQNSIKIIGANLLDLKSLDINAAKILDFKTLINNGVQLSRAYAIDKDIEFEIFIKNTANILTDENRFVACLVNIIKNGIEAIEGKGKIEILAEIKDNIGIIKLSNNGKPISKDKQKDIFVLGYSTKKDGCGIGLALCKKFLQSQNAELKLVKSGKSQTMFEINIPVYSA